MVPQETKMSILGLQSPAQKNKCGHSVLSSTLSKCSISGSGDFSQDDLHSLGGPSSKRYPPTSLSIECVRRCHQQASPSAIKLQHLNSLSSSASQPASTPNLVVASLQARQLAYYLLKGSAFRRERPPRGATARHRLPQDV